MNAEIWNAAISRLPGANILQTAEWGEIKSAYGWRSIEKQWKSERGEVNAAALILIKQVRLLPLTPSMSVMYIPRGPLLDWSDEKLRTRVLQDIKTIAKQEHAIFIKIDPDLLISKGLPGSDQEVVDETGITVVEVLKSEGWKFSPEQIQFKNTVYLALDGDEEEWLARMKPKGRYNLRLASKKGVSVRRALPDDYPLLYRMYAETSIRDGFVIRPEDYYLRIWQKFYQKNMAQALIAEVEGEPVAGIFVFHFAKKAWYLYGMSTDKHRDKMPNYLLQWEGMKYAKEMGCKIYDLWGAPDQFDETDSMWGVFRFKQRLGGEVVCTPGAWDLPVKPVLYSMYMQVLPKILNLLRRRGLKQTRQENAL